MEYTAPFRNKLIYVFQIDDPVHQGCLKIGEATAPDILGLQPNCEKLRDAAKARINQYTQTAGIRYDLLHAESTVYSLDGKICSFNDKQVHEILLRSGVKRKEFDIDGKANEWFCCNLQTAKEAIEAAKRQQSHLPSCKISKAKNPVSLRPEQKEAVEKTIRVFKKGDRMLWNAKMRMGKTISTLEVVKRMQIHRTIIVTHRPVVDDGWFDDFGKIFYEDDTNFVYASKNNGESDIVRLLRSDKHVIYFASMQDLRSSKRVGGTFDKNNEIFDQQWDLLVIDEAHEGTQTELGQAVIDALIGKTTGKQTKQLDLSGTAFNLLDKYDEETTFTWDYIMEQRAKQQWYEDHPGDPNPYEDLPRLNILTFSLGHLLEKYEDEDKAFNFREFFRVNNTGHFVHENDVKRFLDLITTADKATNYPFCTPQLRELFQHTLWIVPGVKEGAALTELLRTHRVFGAYKIVNVAGDEDDEAAYNDALTEVKSAIGERPEDTYTITVSCGKLTTGVTVRPWTAVMHLAGGINTSAMSYMQTIFRVQSPAVIAGRQKRECYVFDFAPDRTLKIIAETAKISAKAGGTTKEDRDILGEFLNFCPIIAANGTRMDKYDVDHMLQQLKRVYVDRVVRSGFEDGHLYNNVLLRLTQTELEKFAGLGELIGRTKASPKTQKIDITVNGFAQEEIEKAQREAKKKGNKTITAEEALQMLEAQRRKRQRDAAISILRGISIRMPLLLYGAELESEEEYITIDRFVQLVDDASWDEFMPQGVTKDRFSEFKAYYDEDIFAASAKQIRRLAMVADSFAVDERVKRISEIFHSFRNPDKETVLTPWRVVNMHMSDTIGGYCFYDQTFENTIDKPRLVDRGLVTQRVFENANAKVLDINAKTGLYPLYMAYGIFRHRLKTLRDLKTHDSLLCDITIDDEREVWNRVLAENIFVICKTEMARRITQRTLCGFGKTKTNTHVYKDLINQITIKRPEFIARLANGQIFKQIRNNMKFDIIVGNPPYQVMDGGAGASALPIYHLFVDAARNLKPLYISMIMPSRWFAGGRGLDEFRASMLTDRRLRKIVDYPISTECFSNVEIKGGICYFLWDMLYEDDCEIVTKENGKITTDKRPLLEVNCETFIRYNEALPILQKVKEKKEPSFAEFVSSQKPFGLRTYVQGRNKQSSKDVVLYANKQVAYIDPDEITQNRSWVNMDKIFISRSYGAGEGFPHQILNKPILGGKGSCCTETYILIGPFESSLIAKNVESYIKTQFFRFLVMLIKNTQDAPKRVYSFVPLQDFTDKSDIDWSRSIADIDRQLYAKYRLSADEIAFIEKTIRPME